MEGVGGVLEGPDQEEVGEGDEAEHGGVVVSECEGEGDGVGEGVLEEDQGGEGRAAAELSRFRQSQFHTTESDAWWTNLNNPITPFQIINILPRSALQQ